METKKTDKIKGVLFGQAIGDALGLGTEFMTKPEVIQTYPNGLSHYEQIVQDFHRSRWQKGDWTDDTDMMLCIAEAIIKDGEISYSTIARNFKQWFRHGMGIGSHTYKVLSMYEYEQRPHDVSKLIWELSRCQSAANGAVMRTSIVGLYQENEVPHAEEICKLTHYDPRCVGSCVIVSLLINNLVYRDNLLPIADLIRLGETYDNRIREYLNIAIYGRLEDLTLDDATMGYTLKTMAAAVWCLYHCNSFEEGLLKIISEGGDADTNGAVTCSLLGAKYGFSAIPIQYVEGLIRKKYLMEVADKLLNIL